MLRFKCPKCGGMYMKDGRCTSCGLLVDTSLANRSKQDVQHNDKPSCSSFCPNCGHPVDSGDKFCSACGKELNASKEAFSDDIQLQSAIVQQALQCPQCGGMMTVQAVDEQQKAGCGTVLFYILLSITILGLLVVIPLLLRKKTETHTYAVCQLCGYKQKLS